MKHPIHPIIAHFPLVCWSLTSLGDLTNRFFDTQLSHAVGILLSIGCISAIVAMIAGLFELTKIKNRDLVAVTADRHMNAAVLTWSLYATSLFLRWDNGFATHLNTWALVTSLTGFIVLTITGWYGGKLVYQFGVGTKLKQP